MLSAKRSRPLTCTHPPEIPPSGVVDRTLEVRRLRKNLTTLIHTSRSVTQSGNSSVVENLALLSGWRSDELVILPVRAFGKKFHVLSAPASMWSKEYEALLDLKHNAEASGEKVVLVPPSYIQREPRLGNARLVASSFHVSLTGEDRMSIFLHLVENGGYSTFHECAMAVVDCEAPYSCVLSMAGMGLVEIDLGKPLTPETRVDLPEAR